VGQEKESAGMVDEFTENDYIILKDVQSYIMSPHEQQQIYDQNWVGWMMVCVCLFCLINYIFGFLKKKEFDKC